MGNARTYRQGNRCEAGSTRKILNEGGSLTAADNQLRVVNANAVTIVLTAATDYWGSDPIEVTANQLQAVSAKTWIR